MKHTHFISRLLISFILILSLTVSVTALHGDLNDDKSISIDDAIIALRFATGIDAPDEHQEHAADLDYDGEITTLDVRKIMRGAAGIDEIPNHLFSDWKTILEPTCQKEGVAESSCIYCKKTVTKALPESDHKIVSATCQSASYCSVCKASFGEPAEHIESEGRCISCNQLLSAPTLSYNNNQIKFGASSSSVKSILGEPKNKYKDATADKTYVVYVYYTDYTDLAIFTFVDSKLTQFFSNATTAAVAQGSTHYGLYCKSAPLKIGDIYLTVYSDAVNNNLNYSFCASVGEKYNLTKTTDFTVNEKINFHLTNGLRAINGASPLEYCEIASVVAEAHSADMAKRNFFDHTNPDGKSPGKRLDEGGVDWTACSENIAAGYYDVYDVVNGWYNSDGHRKNLLNKVYTHIGIGFAYNESSGYKYYGTQNFYKK